MDWHWWTLPCLFVAKMFGSGPQCVPELSVVDVILALIFARKCKSWWELLGLYTVLVIGSTSAMAGLAKHPDMSWTWVGYLLVLQLALQVAFILPYLGDKMVRDSPIAKSVMFPTAYTGMQLFVVYVSPGGSWGVSGYSASKDTPRMYALLSLCGLSTIHFIMAWTASVVVSHLLKQPDRLDRHEYRSTVLNTEAESSDTDSFYDRSYDPNQVASLRSHSRRVVSALCSPRCQIVAYALFMTACCAYGAILGGHGSYLGTQSNEEEIDLCCIAVANTHEVPLDTLFNATESAIIAGSDVVFWSERPAFIEKDKEPELVLRAANMSKSYSKFIGIAYEMGDELGTESRFAFADPNGNVQLRIKRVHTSPFGKGPGHSMSAVRAVETSLGKVGGIMGFDLSFPNFVQKVASDGVRLVLAPSEDYGPIYAAQWNQGPLRASEQGTTVASCSSMYGFTVTSPVGRTLADVPIPHTTVSVLRATVPISEVTSLYSYVGDIFGFLCIAVATVCMLINKTQLPRSGSVASWLHSLRSIG
eukprot:TRINITY_DN12870_c0_g2_i2.p1 TRINITY_DN12870_c0_g2~~TRINITY_DN12870_c0_g2_i2.p1  ORF type:complete len:532 (+),score=52.05 TRINITY_DN12870_c0_g2_i2:101-1696(+)